MKNLKMIMKNKIVRPLRFSITAVLIAAFAATTFGQKLETPPAGGQPKAFIFPKQDTYTLPNGMKVSLVQYGALPKVSVQAVVRGGNLTEKTDQRWISSMVAELVREATTTKTAEDIARETAEMGGSIFSNSQSDKTIVGGDALSEFDVRFINLLADVMLNPKMASTDFETIRENQLRNITISRAQPNTIALEKFREVIFGSHPYGSVFPSEAQVKAYTLDQAKTYYNENYSAARTHLYVVGQFDSAKVKAAIAKAFGGMQKGSAAARNVPKPTATRSLTVIDRPGAPQSLIMMGMPAMSPSDPDYVKFLVMHTLLGGSFGSRITQNIRENKGYTYSPGSTIWNRYNTGFWYETAAVTTQHTGDSIKEILFEINKMATEAPSETELQGIRNYMIGTYVLQNSTRGGVIGQLESVNYNELPKDYLDTYVQKVSAVTAKDMQEMAAKYLKQDKMTIVVVGDKATITEQLKPYEK